MLTYSPQSGTAYGHPGHSHEPWLERELSLSERFARLIGWHEAGVADIPTAVRMDPPWIYQYVWRDLAAALVNAGLSPRRCSFDDVTWYTCKRVPAALVKRMMPEHGTPSDLKLLMAGMWLSHENAIVVRHDMLERLDVVRHHMTHAMRGSSDYDPFWFGEHFSNEWAPQPQHADL